MPARTTPVKRTGTPIAVAAKAPVRDKGARLLAVIDLLEKNLGKPAWDGRKNALEVLVLTILSQNTSDANALRAYQNLSRRQPGGLTRQDTLPRDADGALDKIRLRLSNAASAVAPPHWAQVARLSAAELGNLIRVAGLPAAKARCILAVLVWLEPHDFSLEQIIDNLGLDEAMAAMTRIKGVGAKTAAVTMIEACGTDLCPVDTHVHRIINRLGVVHTNADRDKTFALLRDMIPAGRAYALHHNLLTFGRTVCTARSPKCGQCVLRKLCPSRDKATSR